MYKNTLNSVQRMEDKYLYTNAGLLFSLTATRLLDSNCLKYCVVVATRPLPSNGGMAEDHEAPETGQLPRAWIKGRKETESCKKTSSAESRWTVQNEMTGVLGQVSAGAA